MISIQSKNFSLNEEIEKKIYAKAEKLLHLAGDMTDPSTKITVEFELLSKQKNLIFGSITITLPQDTLRAEAREEQNALSLMDRLEEQIRPQIEKHKNKGKVYKV